MADSRERLVWTAGLFAVVAIDGVALQARGPLLLSFEETFSVSESMLGLIAPASTVGFVAGVILIGGFAGRLRIRWWLIGGISGTAVGYLLLSSAPTYPLLLGFFAFQAAATGAYRGLDRPILSHLYPEQRGRVFNLQSMTWAVGATAGPLVVTGVLIVGDWRHVYLILALAVAPVLLLTLRRKLPAVVGNERPFTREDLRTVVRHRELLVMAVALVVVGGIESVFFTWLPYFANEFSSTAIANLTLSVFLGAYIPGRYLYSRLTQSVAYLTLVIVTVAATAVAIPFALIFAGSGLFLPLVFLVGLLVSGMFPTLLAWGVEITPEFTGPINAAAMSASQVGFFIFPATVGILAEWYSIELAMTIQVALVGTLLLVVLVGRWYTRPLAERSVSA